MNIYENRGLKMCNQNSMTEAAIAE